MHDDQTSFVCRNTRMTFRLSTKLDKHQRSLWTGPPWFQEEIREIFQRSGNALRLTTDWPVKVGLTQIDLEVPIWSSRNHSEFSTSHTLTRKQLKCDTDGLSEPVLNPWQPSEDPPPEKKCSCGRSTYPISTGIVFAGPRGSQCAQLAKPYRWLSRDESATNLAITICSVSFFPNVNLDVIKKGTQIVLTYSGLCEGDCESIKINLTDRLVTQMWTERSCNVRLRRRQWLLYM